MKRSTVLAALFFLVSMYLTVTSAMAVSAIPEWVSQYDSSISYDDTPGSGQKIENVTITKPSSSLYNFDLNLDAAPVVGTTYSLLMSDSNVDFFTNYTNNFDTDVINKRKVLSITFSAHGTFTNTNQTSPPFTASVNDSTLHWQIDPKYLFDNLPFYFAGQSYNTASGDLLSQTKVAATPIPGAAWLLGSGILGMVALRRRSNNNA